MSMPFKTYLVLAASAAMVRRAVPLYSDPDTTTQRRFLRRFEVSEERSTPEFETWIITTAGRSCQEERDWETSESLERGEMGADPV